MIPDSTVGSRCGPGRHKDSGAPIIFAQDDAGGLQVKRKLDGKWIQVRAIPDALIINVGDIVQVYEQLLFTYFSFSFDAFIYLSLSHYFFLCIPQKRLLSGC